MNILVIDTGSSSMRAALMGADASVSFSAAEEYHMHAGIDGKSEVDPGVFRGALEAVCKKAALSVKETGKTINALALTSQRSSVLPVDEKFRPLSRVITWQDKRSAGICKEISEKSGAALYAASGLRLTPVMSAPKMRYLKDTQNSVYCAAHKIIGIHDYLIACLTGLPATDISLASRSALMDIKTRQWSEALCNIFGLDGDKLLPLASPGDIVGETTPAFAKATGLKAKIPVITAGGDQQCSLLGQGVFHNGECGITIGTGAYAAMLAEKPLFHREGKLNLSAAVTKDQWMLEASTLSSGTVYRWVKETVYESSTDYALINSEAEQVQPGAGGVLLLPYFAGKGCPDWDSEAKGTFCNLTLQTTRAQLARAALEGIAAEITDCFMAVHSLHRASPVSLCGGMTVSPLFSQMVADHLNRQVCTYKRKETTVLGAWMVAATAMGLFRSPRDAAEQTGLFREKTVFTPSAENHEVYSILSRKRRQVYESLYDSAGNQGIT